MQDSTTVASHRERYLSVGRSALAAILFRILRPSDAKAAVLSGNALTLIHPSRSLKVPLDEVGKVVLKDGWRWRAMRIGLATGELTVSGLSRSDAKAFAEALELERSRDFFDRVEARPLTDEQRRAVVVDEGRNLVVAAAGSGKTSVIVAKAGWLLHRGFRRPSDLLLLAFARDARTEMEQRVRRRLGEETARDIAVRTFHGMGTSIIGEVEGKRPTLAKVAEDDKALYDLLKRIVADLLADGRFSRILLQWFQERFAPYKSEHDFRSYGEYWDYVRRHEVRSLKGEKVKSFEECQIANFLYLNGVPYEYERAYEHDTATPDRRQYQPDFHLAEAGIYIEHFALNAKGDTPPFINKKEYLRSMDWKRQLHAAHGTTLIETYSHECAAGELTEKLAKKLAAHGVTLSPIPSEEVFAILEEQGRIDPFTGLVANFLGHFKGARGSFEEVNQRAARASDAPRARAFLSVFQAIFERYQGTLTQSGQVDFHDMINKATEHVEAGRYRSPFAYILVDEFQDISPGRARLLKALVDQSPGTQLFAVGDDWQAIFRFAGSDIAIMRGFEERFGAGARVDLETTFRCPDRIARVATEFVLRNPAQITKKVLSTRQASGPSVHVGLAERGVSLMRETLNRVASDAGEYDGMSTVYLLGRYRHTRPPDMSALRKQYPRLRLSYMTVHGSKGLEADYVVVLGLCSGKQLSHGGRGRPAAGSGSGRTRRASERRGAALVLCCPHPREAPSLPSRGRRPPFSLRHGIDRRRVRRDRLREVGAG